jgi:GH18 family chitinase
MKKLLLVLLLFNIITPSFSQPCHDVIAYYPSWKWYDRGKLVNPATIDYSKYTIINYAFFKPTADGNIISGDAWADKNLLGDAAAGKPNKNTLVGKAHAHDVKVLISIGGWTWSKPFPLLASNDVSRKRFADACCDLIKKYDIDGIDIDWEYPGYKLHGGGNADKQNFTLLLTAVRTALDKLELEKSKKLYLTIASGVSEQHLASIEWSNVTGLVDIINLMTYNYSGPWDATTGHNAPLFSNSTTGGSMCIDRTVNSLIEKHLVDPSKIALGMAFYARTSLTKNNAQLNVSALKQADNKTFMSDNGTPEYYNVLLNSHKFIANWDWDAKVPYLVGKNNLNSFVSYDDPVSVGIKAGYAMAKGLRGAVLWELTGDYTESYPGSGTIASTPLANAINSVFCSTDPAFVDKMVASVGTEKTNVPSFLFTEYLLIDCSELGVVNKLKIFDAGGNLVAEVANPDQHKLSFNTKGWEKGVYFVKMELNGEVKVSKVVKV